MYIRKYWKFCVANLTHSNTLQSGRHKKLFFYVHGFVHRESMSITVQQDAAIYSFIIFSADCSTCFG